MVQPAPPLQAISSKELWLYALRFAAALTALLVLVAILSRGFRPELEGIGRGFVARLGYAGMALGTFLADGFHFPVPPQFYMLMAVTSGASLVEAFLWICAASLAGGYAGFLLGARLAQVPWLLRKLSKPRLLVERAVARFGYKAALIASLLPVAFSVLAYLAGLNRLPARFYVVLALCRIPRLALFFCLIALGWERFGG